MTKQQLKSLIKECVCEIQQSLAEKKHKKSEAPKATKAPEPKAAAKTAPKPAPVKKLVKKLTKKNLAKVAPPERRLTAFDPVRIARMAAAEEKRGNKQAARDLNLAKQAANLMLKTGKSKID